MDADHSDQKSRGRKHHTDKKRYKKPTSTFEKKKIIPAQSRSATLLDSNWDRYDQQTEEKTINSSTDYSILANVPIGRGSHFQFKSDKDTFQDDLSKNKTAELFNLDLNLLSLSMGSFPFHTRSNVDDKYFTNYQKTITNRTASENKEKYLKHLETNGLLKPKKSVFDQDADSEEDLEGSQGRDEVDTDDEILDRITPNLPHPLSLEIGQSSKIENLDNANKVQDQDLEKWLDDVLDD